MLEQLNSLLDGIDWRIVAVVFTGLCVWRLPELAATKAKPAKPLATEEPSIADEFDSLVSRLQTRRAAVQEELAELDEVLSRRLTKNS